jgi:hypothetical protein
MFAFADKTKMSEKEFGHYIENFINYLKASTDQTWNVRAGSKSDFPNRWKTAKYKSTFQAFSENSWEIRFIHKRTVRSSMKAHEYFVQIKLLDGIFS